MAGIPDLTTGLFVVLLCYLLGSLPTALLVSRAVAGVDIREIGDGNMGARNVTRTLGWGPGAFVATVDFSKGAAAVLIARYLTLSPTWQLAAGISAVIGHDFPIWVGFRGGQGMASTLGSLFVLLPQETAWGLIAFGSTYLLTHSFDLSAGVGLGLLAALVWYFNEPRVLLIYAVGLFISIPIKKIIDWPRRRRLLRKTRVDHTEAFLAEDLLEEPPIGEEKANGV